MNRSTAANHIRASAEQDGAATRPGVEWLHTYLASWNAGASLNNGTTVDVAVVANCGAVQDGRTRPNQHAVAESGSADVCTRACTQQPAAQRRVPQRG